jgi:hypothetical protein
MPYIFKFYCGIVTNLHVLPGVIGFVYGFGRQRALLLGWTGLRSVTRRIREMLIVDRTLIQFICVISSSLHCEIWN